MHVVVSAVGFLCGVTPLCLDCGLPYVNNYVCFLPCVHTQAYVYIYI